MAPVPLLSILVRILSLAAALHGNLVHTFAIRLALVPASLVAGPQIEDHLVPKRKLKGPGGLPRHSPNLVPCSPYPSFSEPRDPHQLCCSFRFKRMAARRRLGVGESEGCSQGFSFPLHLCMRRLPILLLASLFDISTTY